MTNKQLERRLAQAAAALKPDLPFETIAQGLPAPQETPVVALPHRAFRRRLVAAVAACLVAILVLGGVLMYPKDTPDTPAVQPPVAGTNAVIDIDVNPSVELAVDSADVILSATAVNTDAALLLSRLDLIQQPLAKGVESLFQAMVAQGYVTDGNNSVLVTVQSADNAEAERLHGIVNSGVDAAMARHDLTASVSNQTVTDFDEVTEFARHHGISNGKAAFILSLVEQAPTLDAEMLVDHAFATLAAIAQHENVPLSDLVDYDATDGLWEDIVNALTAELTEAEQRWGSLLKISELKELVLKALNNDYIAENALVVRIDFSWEEDEEYPTYRVELVSRGYLYEYVVNAVDGTFLNPGGSTTTTNPHGIIRSTLVGGGTAVPIDRTTKQPYKTTESPTTTTVAPTTTTTTTMVVSPTVTRPITDGPLTEEQAINYVLFRLGATEAEVQNLSVGHHPYRNELSVYLIYNEYHYCSYFDIATGEETKNVVIPLDVALENYRLDEWEALEIALDDANLTERECDGIAIVYYVHNDASFIFVGWVANDTTYQYHIDGVDGDVAQKIVTPLGGDDAPSSLVIP